MSRFMALLAIACLSCSVAQAQEPVGAMQNGIGQIVSGWTHEGIHGQELASRIHELLAERGVGPLANRPKSNIPRADGIDPPGKGNAYGRNGEVPRGNAYGKNNTRPPQAGSKGQGNAFGRGNPKPPSSRGNSFGRGGGRGKGKGK